MEQVPYSLYQTITVDREIDGLRSSIGIALSVCLLLPLWTFIVSVSLTLVWSRARDPGALAELPSVTARRFWYDTVCYGSKAAICCACEAFGAEKLVTGSDYPVLPDYESYTETFAYIGRPGLPTGYAERILHHNAQALFGFPH
jgi:hypothetical protein